MEIKRAEKIRGIKERFKQLNCCSAMTEPIEKLIDFLAETFEEKSEPEKIEIEDTVEVVFNGKTLRGEVKGIWVDVKVWDSKYDRVGMVSIEDLKLIRKRPGKE